MSVNKEIKKIPSYALKVKSRIHWGKYVKPIIVSSGVNVPYLKGGTKFENLYVGVFNNMFFQGSDKFVETRKIPVLKDKSNYRILTEVINDSVKHDFDGFPLTKSLGYSLVELYRIFGKQVKYPKEIKRYNSHKKFLNGLEYILKKNKKTIVQK